MQYAQNSPPLTFAHDIDFTENRTIENFDKVQSEHLITEEYTLFIYICSFLEVDKWNDECGELALSAEVTVNSEHYLGDNRAKITVNITSSGQKSQSMWEMEFIK